MNGIPSQRHLERARYGIVSRSRNWYDASDQGSQKRKNGISHRRI
jgi:hypothetical protein